MRSVLRSGRCGRLAVVSGAAVGAALALAGCSESGGGSTSLSQGEAQSESGAGSETLDGGAAVVSVTSGALSRGELEEGLARLRAAMAAAGGDARADFDAAYAKALAWVRANREPGRAADVEAQLLAMFDQFLTSDDISIALMSVMTEVELMMAQGMDADGDGVLSEAEIDAWLALGFQDPMKHPYVVAQFDKNGDGKLGMAEMMPLIQKFMPLGDEEGLFKVMGERVMLDRYDADGDGVLSSAEREAAEQELIASVELPDEAVEGFDLTRQIEDLKNNPDLNDEQRAEMLENLEMVSAVWERFGRDPEQRRLNMAMMGLGEQYMQVIGLLVDGMPDEQADGAQAVEIELSEQAVVEHEADQMHGEEFEDGVRFEGGVRVEVELGEADWTEELAQVAVAGEEGTQDVQDWRRDSVRWQYERAAGAVDTNGDGAVLGDEWTGELDRLRAQRDRRVFRHHYDTDGDGRVGLTEVDQFLAWHSAGSKRADANLDGEVDGADLTHFTKSYSDQAAE